MNITTNEIIREVRATAKKNGLTFKQQNARINGKQAWMFTNRTTGQKVIENCTLMSAYENCLSGYVDSVGV